MNSRIGAILVALSLTLPVLAAPSQERALSFEDRVAAQRAIELVAWNHRIWPESNPGPKPPLSAVLSEAELRAKVAKYLQESNALEQLWRRPISAAQLQAELDRMATTTRAPDTLRELFAALGNDARLIAETLARPALADRLARGAYANDERFHGDLRRRAEAALASCSDAACERTMGGRYAEITWRLRADAPSPEMEADVEDGRHLVFLDAADWNDLRMRNGADSGARRAAPGHVEETEDAFFVRAVLSESADSMTTAAVVWDKRPFDVWWPSVAGRLGTTIETPLGSYAIAAPMTGGCAVDDWSNIPAGIAAREDESALWTGSEMIVWGGSYNLVYMDSGGRYDPATNTWTPTPLGGGSPSARANHTAVWTGTEMVVWGGYDGTLHPYRDSGGRYDPTRDRWRATARNGDCPQPRADHLAVWTGTEMIVWGGGPTGSYVVNGARYNPVSDSWTVMSASGAPSGRAYATTVWTGSEMIVWGGMEDYGDYVNSGGRYNPSTDSWQPTSQGAGVPPVRRLHSAVWTGNRMIVWGGWSTTELRTGGLYDPVGDAWTTTSLSGAPSARHFHTAIWTGTEMIVWGGLGDAVLGDGARYIPSGDIWLPMSQGASVPSARNEHDAVWTGSEMLVWGGRGGAGIVAGGGSYCADGCAVPAMLYADSDGDGFGDPNVTLVTCGSPPGWVPIAGDCDDSRAEAHPGATEVCNGLDDDCDTAVDEGIPVPSVSSTLALTLFEADAAYVVLQWTAVPNATSYDVVTGDLEALHASGGDFAASTTACVNDNVTILIALAPGSGAAGSGAWHLVRAVNACSGNGSYDDGTQQGSRDAEIAASGQACP